MTTGGLQVLERPTTYVPTNKTLEDIYNGSINSSNPLHQILICEADPDFRRSLVDKISKEYAPNSTIIEDGSCDALIERLKGETPNKKSYDYILVGDEEPSEDNDIAMEAIEKAINYSKGVHFFITYVQNRNRSQLTKLGVQSVPKGTVKSYPDGILKRIFKV